MIFQFPEQGIDWPAWISALSTLFGVGFGVFAYINWRAQFRNQKDAEIQLQYNDRISDLEGKLVGVVASNGHPKHVELYNESRISFMVFNLAKDHHLNEAQSKIISRIMDSHRCEKLILHDGSVNLSEADKMLKESAPLKTEFRVAMAPKLLKWPSLKRLARK